MTRTLLLGIAALLCLAACGSADPAEREEIDPGPTLPAPLSANGWGPLRIGMSTEEVLAAVGGDANPQAVGGPDPERCDEFRPARAPAGLMVMMEQGSLARITLMRGSTIKTDRGFGVGDPADTIKASYGDRAIVSPHKYLASPAEYIRVMAPELADPTPLGIVYEIGLDAHVSHVHAGGPSIRYVEGCL